MRTPARVRTRVALGVLVLAVLAGLLALPSRPARAAVAEAPAATGWYVTRRDASAGVEVVHLRRDEPLARATVAFLPRTGLYRLRTVLASDRLIGGTGRDLTSNLCARWHCHAAINGDRWDLSGHDAGRLTGAVAVGGELIATQPLPPADPYGHVVLGNSGSLAGTIRFPMEGVAPEVQAGGETIPVDVNRQPMVGRTTVLNRRYATETRTPPGTVEYLLSATGGTDANRTLVPASRREGSGPIPEGTVVVAANGSDAIARAEAWWAEALLAGSATYRNGIGDTREIIGGSPLLLSGGDYGFPPNASSREPRSAFGWDAQRVMLIAVDGRQPGWSNGVTYVELAQLARWLGATDAINLDGGGSTTFIGFGDLRNRPSGGSQRHVASALVIMPPENQVGPPPPALSLDPACPPGRVPANPYPDAIGTTHSPAIGCMAWWRITTGTGDGTYDPLRSVRRDQMAAFLARYLYVAGATFPANPPDAFPDDEGSIHEPYIDALAAMGVIGGRADGRFAPSGEVTRGQMATFLARAVPLATGAALSSSTDYFADDAGDVHEPSINKLAEAKLAGGTSDGRYRSGAPVRRDQMASFLARAVTAAVDAGRATPPG